MTSRVFDLIHSKTLALEGGGKVTNNPSDRGGLTKYGISQKAFPNEDIANLTLERARQLAYDTYWVPIKLDQVTVIRVAEEMFDTG